MALPDQLSEFGKPHMQFYIVSAMHQKVLDIKGSDGSEGAMVTTWGKKNPPSKSQLWYIDKEGFIRSALNDFAPRSNGIRKQVTMHSFNGNLNQQWRFEGRKIKCGVDGCLAIANANVNDGAFVIVNPYNSTPNEKWTAENVRFWIVSEQYGRVLDIEGGEELARAGTNIILHTKHLWVSRNQLWYIDDQAVIRSVIRDFAITADANAEQLSVHPFNGGANQQWRFSGKMIMSESGEYLDVVRANNRYGAKIISNNHNGSITQRWSAEIV